MAYIGVQPAAGQYRKLDDVSAGFNGTSTTFTTSVSGENVTAGTAQQLLVSVGGVIQEPKTDYDVSTNSIVFTTAPAAGLDFFAVLMGDAVNTITVPDGSVTTAKLAGSLSVGLAGGTNSAPTLFFTGDTNTGVYSPGADQVAVTTGGTQRFLIDASGNLNVDSNTLYVDAANNRVGIGNSSVSDLLHIGNSSVTTRTAIRVQTGNAYSDPNSVSYSNALSAVGARYAIDGTANGYVGQIGVGNTANLWLGSWNNGATDGSIQFVTGNNTTSTIRATLNSTGLGIGTTSPAASLDVNGSALLSNSSYLGWGNADALIQGSSASAANFLMFRTNLTERARIDHSGRFLVGTSSSRASYAANLEIEGTTSTATVAVTRNSNDTAPSYLFLAKSRSTSVGGNAIVNNGDILGYIGFLGSDGTVPRLAASITSEVDATPGASDMPGRLVFSTTADGASSPTERARISSNGTANFYSQDDVIYARSNKTAGTIYATYVGVYGATSTTTGTLSFVVWSNGNVQNTNNSYTAISDIKLKENIVDANSQWDDIKALQVRNYNLKEGQTHRQIGLIAQEVEPISPGLVYESPDRDEEGNDLGTVTKSVNYSVLYMKAVKALQEAMERIETLEAKVAALESA